MLGSAAAQEAEVSANAGWLSQYFYRGILQKTSSASAGLDVGFGALSLGTWLADVGDGTEIDLFGSVGGEVEGGKLSAGGTAYLYTGQFDDTYLEANLGAGYGPLSVEFSSDSTKTSMPTPWTIGSSASRRSTRDSMAHTGPSDLTSTEPTGGRVRLFGGELDFTISGVLNDSDLSGLVDGDDNPTTGLTLVFGISKTFNLM